MPGLDFGLSGCSTPRHASMEHLIKEKQSIEDNIKELNRSLQEHKKEIVNIETELGWQKILLDKKKEEIRKINYERK